MRTAQEIIEQLKMRPIPHEGGWFAPGPRTQALSSITFLLTDTSWGFSAMHRLAVDEGWQWLDGSPVALLRLRAKGRGTLNLLSRQRSSYLVRAGWWQGAAPMGAWSLLSAWCSPAYRPQHFELGQRAPLIEAYPRWTDEITALTRERSEP